MKLLKLVANLIAIPIWHVLNLSLEKCIFPQAWKIAKIISLPKNNTVSSCDSSSRPISCWLHWVKSWWELLLIKYNAIFQLMTWIQTIKEHSTATVLTSMTEEWLREIDNTHLVGAALLDFSAAFDIIDHNLLLQIFKC